MKRVIALVLAVVFMVSCLGFASAEEDYSQYLGYGTVSTSSDFLGVVGVDLSLLYNELVSMYDYIGITRTTYNGEYIWAFIGSAEPLVVCSQGHDTGSWDCSFYMLSSSNDLKFFMYNANNGYVSSALDSINMLTNSNDNTSWLDGYYYWSAANNPIGFSYYGLLYGKASRGISFYYDIQVWSNHDVVDIITNQVVVPANLDVAVNDYEHYIGTYQGVKCLYIPCGSAPTSLPITVTLGDGSILTFEMDSYQFVPSLGGNDLSYAVIPLYDLSSELSFVIWQSSVNMYGDVLVCNTELLVDNFTNADISDKLTGTSPEFVTPNTDFPLDDMLHYYTNTLPNSGEITSLDTVLSFISELEAYEDKYGISLNVGYLVNSQGIVNWVPYGDIELYLHNLPQLVWNFGNDIGASAILGSMIYDVIIYRYHYTTSTVDGDVEQDYYSIYLTPLYYARQITTIQRALSVISNRMGEMYELMYNSYYTDVQFLKEFIHSMSEVNSNISSMENSLVAEIKALKLLADVSAVESLLMQILNEFQNFEIPEIKFTGLLLPDWLVATKDFVTDFIALPITATGQSVGVIADGITWIFNFYTSTDGSGFIEVDENGNPSISVDLEDSGSTGYLPVLEE